MTTMMEKTNLCSPKAQSLYIHLPFCSHICGYCDFTKLIYKESFSKAYLAKLKEEILSFSLPTHLKTIYLGGGTPSALSIEELEDLLSFLSAYHDENCEFSFEGNPENMTLEKMILLKKCGVNRISIGVQSSHQKRLDYLGRKHSFLEAKSCIESLKKVGFSNINVDLMYGFSDEKMQEVEEDIVSFLSLDVPHISTYSFILEENSIFAKKGEMEAKEDLTADQYELILKKLREKSYERYEVSNFAKPGYESRHNLTYWKDEEYFGAGLGASGYLSGIRYSNTKSLKRYLEGQFKEKEEKVSFNDDIEYFLLTNLRLKEGFSDEIFSRRFGFSFLEKYQNVIQKQLQSGLLEVLGKQVFPTDKGILLLDRILLDYFD